MFLLDPRIVQRRVAKINRMKAASKVRYQAWKRKETDRYVLRRREECLWIIRVVECDRIGHSWNESLTKCRNCGIEYFDWVQNAPKYRRKYKFVRSSGL